MKKGEFEKHGLRLEGEVDDDEVLRRQKCVHTVKIDLKKTMHCNISLSAPRFGLARAVALWRARLIVG